MTFWTKFSKFILDPIPPNVFRYIRLLIIYKSINMENSDTSLEFMQAFLLCWIYYLETSSLWRPPRAPRALTSGIKVGVVRLSVGRWGRSKAWSGRRSVLETISVFKSLTGLSFGGCLELQKKYKLYYFFWSWWPLYITLQNISSGVCVQASSIWEHVLYSYILITIYIIFQM